MATWAEEFVSAFQTLFFLEITDRLNMDGLFMKF